MAAIFVGYLALTLLLGLWQARRMGTQADFVLGGAKLPGWMLALSERATGESAWLLLGFTGFVYANGISGIWIGVGCLVGISTAWIVLAAKFRAEAREYNALTMPEYFSAKFPDRAATIRVLSTLIIVFFFVFYVGAQFAGAGKTIFLTFGLDPLWGQLIAAAVILTYATAGGFISVVAVDTFQSILMIATLVLTPVIMLFQIVDEPGAISDALTAAGPSMESLTGGLAGFGAGLLVLNNLAWFFGYLGGQPQLNARFMAMRDAGHVRTGRNTAIIWTLFAYAGAVLIGLCAVKLFGPAAVPDPEMILPHILTQLFPWWLAAILLAGVVAAMISTAESMLLVAASSVSQDVYNGILRRGRADERVLLKISRGATVVVGVLAFVLALTTSDLIYYIVSYAWAGIGCSFAPAVLLSFYWRRFGSVGVVTALAVGLATTIIWIATGLDQTITARAVTFFASIGAAVIGTYLTPQR